MQGLKQAHRRGGGILVGVQPPLQRLVGGLQPHLMHIKGRRPAGIRGTTMLSCNMHSTALLKQPGVETSTGSRSCFCAFSMS